MKLKSTHISNKAKLNNEPSAYLAIDDMDTGVFEYLLGELLGMKNLLALFFVLIIEVVFTTSIKK